MSIFRGIFSKYQQSAPLFLCLSLTMACGKSSGSGDDKTSSEDTASLPIAITGQLVLSGLNLASEEQAVLLYQFAQGKVIGQPEIVSVDAEGKFTANIQRANETLDVLVAQAKLPREQRDWEVLLKAVQSYFGGSTADFTVEKLKGFPEEEFQKSIGEAANEAKDAGRMSVLVAYQKSATGDLKAEASSFRFIGMPTAGNRSLSGFPNAAFKGNTDLGQVTADSKDATTELKADAALELKADTIENLADLSKMLKIVKNYYMNKNWSVRPFYFWEGNTAYTSIIDNWSNVSAATYKGYGFYVPSVGDQGLSQADVCGGKAIELVPPSSVNLKDQATSPLRALTKFTNAGTSVVAGQDTCQGGQDFYGRMDNYDGISYMLNFGTGGSIQESPEGLWALTVAGVEKGSYDLASVLPIDANQKPLVFLPRAKFNKLDNKIVSVDVEFYKWNGADYTKVTDSQLLRSLFSSVSATVGNDNDKAHSARVSLKILENGDLHADLDGTQKDGDDVALNSPVLVSDIGNSGFAISYEIGEVSYRTEYR